MTIVTIYALFGSDIDNLAFTATADPTFDVLTIIALVLFGIEIILASIAKEDYFLGFYFWLDLVATLSLILDITWFWTAVLGTGGNVSGSAAKAAKAGRASRASRVARIARIVRLIRLIRIVKLYKSANMALQKEELLEENQVSPQND
jgi:Ion transport protein